MSNDLLVNITENSIEWRNTFINSKGGASYARVNSDNLLSHIFGIN